MTLRLRIVYRSSGGDNPKQRPDYYSKLLALQSMVRAAGALAHRCDVVFLNDGPIPDDRMAVMAAHGQIVPIDAGSNRRSYRAAVRLAARLPGSPADLVWFAEDDYLYRPEAFLSLVAAAERLTGADYFALYGIRALDPTGGGRSPRFRAVAGAGDDPDAVAVAGARWFRAVSTTSTFGVRVRALREDRHLLRACPFTGGAWDHTTCLVVQGLRPFTAAELRPDLLPGRPLAGWPRAWWRGISRGAVDLRAMRRAARRRVFVASDPELVSHMDCTAEVGIATRTADWSDVAADAAAWAAP